MKENKMKAESSAQAEAFLRMQGNELELIHAHAAGFRKTIADFERLYGRVPTADELLWIESESLGRDITQ